MPYPPVPELFTSSIVQFLIVMFVLPVLFMPTLGTVVLLLPARSYFMVKPLQSNATLSAVIAKHVPGAVKSMVIFILVFRSPHTVLSAA